MFSHKNFFLDNFKRRRFASKDTDLTGNHYVVRSKNIKTFEYNVKAFFERIFVVFLL